MNVILNAIIKNNIPYCAECKEKLYGRTIDYDTIIHNGQKYTQFKVRCHKCDTDNQYCSDVRIAGTRRYVFDKSEMKKFTDEIK